MRSIHGHTGLTVDQFSGLLESERRAERRSREAGDAEKQEQCSD